MRISLESGGGYAPGCYLIRCEETRRTELVQTDWDFPSLAVTFGMPCDASGSEPSIPAAREYLDSVADGGMTVEDPGYFDGGEGGAA